MFPSDPRPPLRPPVARRWTQAGLLDFSAVTPVSDGRVVVLADTDALVALDAATGALRWRVESAPVDLVQTAHGIVYTTHGKRNEWIVAADWQGNELWRVDGGFSMGSGSLRAARDAEGDTLLALGFPSGPGSPLACRVYDARSGDLRLHFPNPGDLPHRVPRGWVYSARAAEGPRAGLYLVEEGSPATLHLLPHAHSVRTVAGSIVVVDTFEPGMSESRLLAVDSDGGALLWEGAGGPNLTLAADSPHLLATTFAPNGRIAAVLRDLTTGARLWQSEPIAGAQAASFASVALAADTALVTVPLHSLSLLDRATGRLLQRLETRSTLTFGPCLLPDGLVDVCLEEVRCYTAGHG